MKFTPILLHGKLLHAVQSKLSTGYRGWISCITSRFLSGSKDVKLLTATNPAHVAGLIPAVAPE
jgi:hypothetical protein